MAAMRIGKHRFGRSVAAVVEGTKGVGRDLRDVTTNSRADIAIAVPPEGATIHEKLGYVDAARLTVGRLEAPEEDGGRGIAPPFLALCRAAADTHPELVVAVVEPLLAHRRRLG